MDIQKPSGALVISVTYLELYDSQRRLSCQVWILLRLEEKHAHSLRNHWRLDELLFPHGMDLLELWQSFPDSIHSLLRICCREQNCIEPISSAMDEIKFLSDPI